MVFFDECKPWANRRGLDRVDELLTELVARNDLERVPRRVEFEDSAAIRLREVVGVDCDGAEHLLEVERRADRAADLPHRPNLLERPLLLVDVPFQGLRHLVERAGELTDFIA